MPPAPARHRRLCAFTWTAIGELARLAAVAALVAGFSGMAAMIVAAGTDAGAPPTLQAEAR